MNRFNFAILTLLMCNITLISAHATVIASRPGLNAKAVVNITWINEANQDFIFDYRTTTSGNGNSIHETRVHANRKTNIILNLKHIGYYYMAINIIGVNIINIEKTNTYNLLEALKNFELGKKPMHIAIQECASNAYHNFNGYLAFKLSDHREEKSSSGLTKYYNISIKIDKTGAVTIYDHNGMWELSRIPNI